MSGKGLGENHEKIFQLGDMLFALLKIGFRCYFIQEKVDRFDYHELHIGLTKMIPGPGFIEVNCYVSDYEIVVWFSEGDALTFDNDPKNLGEIMKPDSLFCKESKTIFIFFYDLLKEAVWEAV